MAWSKAGVHKLYRVQRTKLDNPVKTSKNPGVTRADNTAQLALGQGKLWTHLVIAQSLLRVEPFRDTLGPAELNRSDAYEISITQITVRKGNGRLRPKESGRSPDSYASRRSTR